MKPLYEISSDYQILLQHLDNCDDIDDEQIHLLNEINGDLKQKAINIGSIIKNMEAEVDAITHAIEDMEKRQSVALRKVSKLKDYLKVNLEQCEMREVKSPYFDIKIKTNPASVNIINEDLVPSKYIHQTTLSRIDKKQISEALKQNVSIPGCMLIQNTRLEIR